MKMWLAVFTSIVAQVMLVLAPVASRVEPVCLAGCPHCLAASQTPRPVPAAPSCCADHAKTVSLPLHPPDGEIMFQGCCCAPEPWLPAPAMATIFVAPPEVWVALPAPLNADGLRSPAPGTHRAAVAPPEADRVAPPSRPLYLRYHVFLT